jgi:hypothetical protein
MSHSIKYILISFFLFLNQIHHQSHTNAVAIIQTSSSSVLDEATDIIQNTAGQALEHVKSKYNQLPPKGKFATGAICGFTSSKIIVKQTMRTVKFAGAAFIISEVMDRVGLLDDVKTNNHQAIQMMKQKVTSTIKDCRLSIQKHVTLDNVRSIFDNAMTQDKMATLGFTTGTVAGLVW